MSLFSPVSREENTRSRTRENQIKPTQPICRGLWARFVTIFQETVLGRHSILRTFQKIWHWYSERIICLLKVLICPQQV